jgi:uncharacterized Fe-S cluster-containing radical SAM superfamily protein
MSEKVKNPFQLEYSLCNRPMKEKLSKPLYFPRIVDVELTNKCNMRCGMCPTGQREVARPKGYMDMKVLYRILNECEHHKPVIRFIRWGEPLLYPRIIDAIKACKDRNLMCHINTNGLLLDYALSNELIESHLDSIKFSFQGVTAEGYCLMRNINQFESLLERISVLHKIRGKRKHPFIQIGTTVTTETDREVEAFISRASSFTDAVYVGKTRDLKAENKPEAACECPEVFDKLSVNWDGTVTACCGDYDNMMLIGDMKNTPLMNIWRGRELEEYRQKLAAYRHNELPLCKHCARSKEL